MPARRIDIGGEAATDRHEPAELAARLAAIRAELEVTEEFPADVAAAAVAVAAAPRWPASDRTDLELLTIDPEGSVDLDQALHIGRDVAADNPGGYVVSYAIADVGAFVGPGDPLDLESHRRGQTLYAPGHRIPLYPTVLCEGAGSLLAGQDRPALLWTIRLGADGQTVDADVVRAKVRSRRQLSYVDAQAEIDAAGPDLSESLALLAEVGPLRVECERLRGGVSLDVGEQEVHVDPGTDHWSLVFRAGLPVETWNAQISLLTGMAAAAMMIEAKVGLLRTLPPAEPGAIRRLRHTASALHIPWPEQQGYPEFVRSLDPGRPDHAAMMNACTTLFRGAGYQAFEATLPEQTEHSALATPYAHVTAPLRRLVDRYAGEICLALCAGQPVPGWVSTALDALPAEMAASDRRAKSYERKIIDSVEAMLLANRIGETFSAVVLEVDEKRARGSIMISDPAVEARVEGADLPLGERISVRLTTADIATGTVRFTRS